MWDLGATKGIGKSWVTVSNSGREVSWPLSFSLSLVLPIIFSLWFHFPELCRNQRCFLSCSSLTDNETVLYSSLCWREDGWVKVIDEGQEGKVLSSGVTVLEDPFQGFSENPWNTDVVLYSVGQQICHGQRFQGRAAALRKERAGLSYSSDCFSVSWPTSPKSVG